VNVRGWSTQAIPLLFAGCTPASRSSHPYCAVLEPEGGLIMEESTSVNAALCPGQRRWRPPTGRERLRLLLERSVGEERDFSQEEGTMVDQHILDDQISYYRQRAQEYDETTGQTEELQRAFARARALLQHLAPCEQMLELACGTGTWTHALLPLGQELTAIDASPEMLALARQKVGNASVQFQQADLFEWQPSQQYDLVFFANWLSHVPPHRLNAFVGTVARAVRPGGSLAIMDQYAPMQEDRESSVQTEEGAIYASRSLLNGQAFLIVKVFYDLHIMEHMLAALGFAVTIQKLDDIFFFLQARRKG
jgi:ubiquinone/menaquinone biosynthesis C-methylase UbiE